MSFYHERAYALDDFSFYSFLHGNLHTEKSDEFLNNENSYKLTAYYVRVP